MLKKIGEVEDFERNMFGARKRPFSEHMERWISQIRPDQLNNNFFEVKGKLTFGEIEDAIAQEKDRGLHELLIRSGKPLDRLWGDVYDFQPGVQHTMVLLRDKSQSWQENTDITIRDIQKEDISQDLLNVSMVPEEYREQAYRNMKLVLTTAQVYPEYHWLCAYAEGKMVGMLCALTHGGYTVMDDLWVDPQYRNRYIATSLMRYAAQNIGGTLFLHVDGDTTLPEMYGKMGFSTVKTDYEYFLSW